MRRNPIKPPEGRGPSGGFSCIEYQGNSITIPPDSAKKEQKIDVLLISVHP
jgi:hypothetical protein